MIFETFGQFRKMLGQLDQWLDQAATFAKDKSFDPSIFLGFRLAPNQFPFARQVQIACDTAKVAASKLSGKETPTHPDTEQTLDELQARVRAVVAYLGDFTAADFETEVRVACSDPCHSSSLAFRRSELDMVDEDVA